MALTTVVLKMGAREGEDTKIRQVRRGVRGQAPLLGALAVSLLDK